jgi:NAD(P)-dependent dehydrogenase (short-subunit alcohol dehydrogenase family)
MRTASQRIVAQALSAIPVQRRGEADEVAAAAVFLASNEASYIRVHTLGVDGGKLLL